MKRLVKFRPLRRIAKTGKIVVASYSSWRKVATSDYNEFDLIIDNEYRSLPKDELVYNIKGELLFFYQYNPNEIPIYSYPFGLDVSALTRDYGLDWGDNVSYSGSGIDCDGVPAFTHYTADLIATHNSDIDDFEPLTVYKVIEWYAWFLFRLSKADIELKNNQ